MCLCLRNQEGLFLLVSVGMFDHSVFPDESLSADIAGERLLPCVQAHVTSKIRLVVELLGADLAFVGFITGMFSKMLLEERERSKKSLKKLVLSIRNGCFS